MESFFYRKHEEFGKKSPEFTYRNHLEAHRRKIIMFCIVLVMAILCVNLVFAEMSFDNTYSFDDKIGDYGKYEIKDWFGLLKLKEITLLENTESCFWKYCTAKKEITMFQDGILVDDIRFLEDGKEVNINSYNFYIEDGDKRIKYELGTEVEQGTYTLVLEGEIKPKQIIDWQIKIDNKEWSLNWALWTGGDAPIGYWSLDETTGDIASNEITGSETGNMTNTENEDWVSGKINNGIDFDGVDEFMNITSISKLPSGNQNFSFSVWVNSDTWDIDNMYILKWGDETPSTDGEAMKFFYSNSGNGKVSLNFVGAYILDSPTVDLSGSWHHLAVVYSQGRNISLYVDGVINGSAIIGGDLIIPAGKSVYVGRYITASKLPFDGQIDELGIWNRTLSSDEIVKLYNQGFGLGFGEILAINLISPIDNKIFSLEKDINFTANYSSNEGMVNGTYYIWDSDGDVVNQTTRAVPPTTNSTTLLIEEFDSGIYTWNVYGCSNVECNWGTSNFTFTWREFEVINEDWNNLTIEGNVERFDLNITLNEGFQISSATLVYNNTNNLGTFTNIAGNNYTISRLINVPPVTTQTNISFYWSFLLDEGGVVNTTTHIQTIDNIGIDDCSTNTVLILNYSLLDEEDRDFLNGTLFNTTIEVDVDISPLGTTTSIINFSSTFTDKNPASVCLSINLSNTKYRMDATTRYESRDRISEFHHIQNYTLTNTTIPIEIDLHDLKTADSTTFLITFENEDFLPEENALIDITRKYIGDGVFRSVEIGKTDSNGQTLGHFVVSDATYTIIVSKEGTILATFDNILAICNDVLIGDCKINLNTFSTSIPLEDFRRSGGITHTPLVFDEDARTITTSFTSTTGGTKTVLLNATKFDRFGNQQVCSDSLTSSAGSLTCNIPASLGNITIITDLFSDGNLISQEVFTINPDARANWGGSYTTAILMGILAINTIALMFVSSPVGILIGALLGLILVSVLVIINSGSILGTSSALIWFIVAISIVIYKIVQRKR